MGIGVVIRNSQGDDVLAAMNTCDSISTEARAAFTAHLFCRDLGLSNVILERDAKVVVYAVNNSQEISSSMGILLRKSSSLYLVLIHYVRRHFNQDFFITHISSTIFMFLCDNYSGGLNVTDL